MSTASQVIGALRQCRDPERAKNSAWFFKTGKGEYAEGDRFWGITVPQQRTIARQFPDLPLSELAVLLGSPIHEQRLTALFILVRQFERSEENGRRELAEFYLRHLSAVNNWDLVDSSAPYILGPYLRDKPKDRLYALVRSPIIWERRVAVLSTYAYIRDGDFSDTLRMAEILLPDRHNLIHKAVGWMLREIGKRDAAVSRRFLDSYAPEMPRTMLRYAIERFPDQVRSRYLRATSL